MYAMNAGDSQICAIVGNALKDLPWGGIAFLWHVCAFCHNEKVVCLVNDSSYGEYGPASVCVVCIGRLYPAMLSIEERD